jgi:hypothetical protein
MGEGEKDKRPKTKDKRKKSSEAKIPTEESGIKG